MDENIKNLEMKLKVFGFPYCLDIPTVDFSIESWAFLSLSISNLHVKFCIIYLNTNF